MSGDFAFLGRWPVKRGFFNVNFEKSFPLQMKIYKKGKEDR
jgi:hypothetical protein